MGRFTKSVATGVSLAMFLTLAGCDSAEERAEAHFESALELVAKGDFDRASIEFRNVFKLNGSHYEARRAYAAMQREQGNFREAIGQYQRLLEQLPEDVPSMQVLAEMYAELGAWEQMDRFVSGLKEFDPEGQKTKALNLVQTYRLAVDARQSDVAKQAAADARAFLSEMPDYLLLHQIAIDDDIRATRYDDAVAGLDKAVEIFPENKTMWAVRLSVLAAQGDTLGIEEQLRDNIERFPDDNSYRNTLVNFYVSQGLHDTAEEVMREETDRDDVTEEANLRLVRFLSQVRGPEVAVAELDKLIVKDKNNAIFHSLRAGILFDLGQIDDAIKGLETQRDISETTDEHQHIRITLAKMYDQTGRTDEARKLVDEILATDSINVEALKLKAEWLIQDDNTGEAIASLRSALDQKSDDPDIYVALARAHERDGNDELVGEMLSLAVNASGSDAFYAANYATYLIARDRVTAAEAVLADALKRAPTDVRLLTMLGRVNLRRGEWERAKQVIATLRNVPSDEAQQSANAIQSGLLQGQQRSDEAVAFMRGLVDEGQGGFETDAAIVQTHFANDDAEAAKAYLKEQLKKRPDDRDLLFLDAAADIAIDQPDKAEASFRALLKDDPSEVRVWLGLFRLLDQQGRAEEAAEVAEKGAKAVPDSATLHWIRAGIMERNGDIAGAVDVYETLYAQDSDNLIVANNLASLLVELKQDPETVSRAFTIARRLRAAKLAPYQDTYGWLAVLRGDFGDAVPALEFAAQGLPQDPKVKYHLAKAYLGAEQRPQALETFEAVLTMVDPASTEAFVVDTKAQIEAIKADSAGGSE